MAETEDVKTPTEAPKTTGSKTGSGLEPNVASMLCYLPWAGGIISIVFLIIEKDARVKFNAVQALGFDVFYFLVSLVWGMIYGAMIVSMAFSGGLGAFALLSWISTLIWVGYLVVTIMLMVKSYQGKDWELPVIGKIAHNFVK